MLSYNIGCPNLSIYPSVCKELFGYYVLFLYIISEFYCTLYVQTCNFMEFIVSIMYKSDCLGNRSKSFYFHFILIVLQLHPYPHSQAEYVVWHKVLPLPDLVP